MTTHDESKDRQRAGHSSNAPATPGSNRRLFLLIGLLALALFALWYDYKVARPAVEQAYDRIAATNDEINSAAEHRRMTSTDVQSVLKRSPSETFTKGPYTIEAYRWRAGLPIELRGLKADESPGIGLKTFNYYAVYRKDGPELAFMTHFKFDLDPEYFDVSPVTAATDGGAPTPEEMSSMGMGMPGGGPGSGGGPGGGEFDPEALFAERDADSDGKLTGDEISERLRGSLDEVDTDGDGAVSKEEFIAGMAQRGGRGGPSGPGAGGPGAGGPGGEGEPRRQRPPLESTEEAPEAAPSDAAPTAESKEPAAAPAPEKPSADATPEAEGETAKEESSRES